MAVWLTLVNCLWNVKLLIIIKWPIQMLSKCMKLEQPALCLWHLIDMAGVFGPGPTVPVLYTTEVDWLAGLIVWNCL